MSNDQDPRVTDLRRYRKARERARRQPPPKPPQARQSFLGPRKNAGLILGLAVLLMLALWVGPALMRVLS